MQPDAAELRGFVIRDKSTRWWGFGRSTVTATSIISDTIWSNTLQEIRRHDDGHADKALWTNSMIGVGGDESDFYDALGTVGVGRIGNYIGILVTETPTATGIVSDVCSMASLGTASWIAV